MHDRSSEREEKLVPLSNRLEREAAIVERMIDLYCHKRLGLDEVPSEYQELKQYARKRLSHCRWGDRKPACKHCPTHCYAPVRRAIIREVMRWAGPRMLWYAPKAAIRHLLSSLFARSLRR